MLNSPVQEPPAFNDYIKVLMNTWNFAVASAPEGEH